METDEAKPVWIEKAGIPFERMWPGDRIWLPAVLRGERFEGSFWFDKENKRLLDSRMSILP